MDIKFRFREVLHALAGARRVLVIAHRKPDGDTLGASCGLMSFLAGRGIAADAFCMDRPPEQYRFLPFIEKFTDDREVFGGEYDVVAVIDSSDLRYAGVAELVPRLAGNPKLISVDHHITNEGFGQINAVDGSASSACEVLYRLLVECGERLTPDIATCLLTGIVTDTNGFNNHSTSPSAFIAASELLKAGARFQEPFKNVLRNRPIPSLRLWGQTMARLKFDERHGIASTPLFLSDFKDGVDEENVDGIANFLAMYLDVPVILVLREIAGGKVKGSMRSVGHRDVAALATVLNGGGHKEAAGFLLSGVIKEAGHGWIVEHAA